MRIVAERSVKANSNKDLVLSKQVTRMIINWPRLTKNQEELLWQTLDDYAEPDIPDIVTHIIDNISWQPKVADVREAAKKVRAAKYRFGKKEYDPLRDHPPLPQKEVRFNVWMSRAISTLVGNQFAMEAQGKRTRRVLDLEFIIEGLKNWERHGIVIAGQLMADFKKQLQQVTGGKK